MNLFAGTDLEIALNLNEGHDFGFINSEFAVRVSLDSNEICTNTFPCEQLVKFDCELIFSSTKANIKRMKSHKVPVRLDFCRMDNKVLQKPFGYIILHLSEAQYLRKGEHALIKEDIHKVCGLGKEARGSCPQVALGLRIQDIPDEKNDVLPESNKKESVSKPLKRTDLAKKSIPAGNGTPIAPLHSYEITLDFKQLSWLTAVKDVHLRIHHGKGEVTWSAHKEINEAAPGTINQLDNLTANISFLESPSDVEAFLKTHPPQITICTLRHGRPVVLGRAALDISAVNQNFEQSVIVRNLLTSEEMATFTYRPFLKNKGPQIMRELSVVKNEDGITDKLANEMELWKKSEREKFQQEFDERLKLELIRIDSEFTEKQQKLENEITEKANVCRTLSDELNKVMGEVKEKEIYLEKSKQEIEAGFQSILAETNRETTALRENLLCRLNEKEEENSKLQDEILELKAHFETKNHDITIEQVEALVTEMKKMQEKLESATKTKFFFKEQWTRTVRELIRLKSGESGNIQVELKLNKKELQQLGLDEMIDKKVPGNKN